MTKHFAAYNRHFLNGPDDERIRVVNGEVSVYTDQHDSPGSMILSIAPLGSRDQAVVYRLIETEDGQLSLPLSNGIEFRAANWLELGKQIDLRGTLPEYGDELAALFQQVGGDPAYQDTFRLELYWKPPVPRKEHILFDPLRKAFGLEDDVAEFSVIRRSSRHSGAILLEGDDTVRMYGFPGTYGGIGIFTEVMDGITVLYTNYPDAERKSESHSVYAQDWLHLAEQLERINTKIFPQPILDLMRQAGGDPKATGYELFAKRAGSGNWIRMKAAS